MVAISSEAMRQKRRRPRRFLLQCANKDCDVAEDAGLKVYAVERMSRRVFLTNGQHVCCQKFPRQKVVAAEKQWVTPARKSGKEREKGG